MSWLDIFIDNRLTGWGAAGIVVAIVFILVLTDRLQWHKRAKETAAFWKTSSDKWENATHTRDIQLGMALEQLRIVGTFFKEVDVRQIEDIEKTLDRKQIPE